MIFPTLLLAGALAVPALGETPIPPPQPLCFPGAPDYSYADGRLWINIQIQVAYTPELLTYFVCDIQTTDQGSLKTALSGDIPMGPREATADIADRHGAKLAINGDAYGFHNHGIIVRNGEIIRTRQSNSYHLLALNGDGDLSVIPGHTTTGQDGAVLADALVRGGAVQVWAFGPELVRDGVAVNFDDFRVISPRDSAREPRTAIGQIEPLHYVVVVADGRGKGRSAGMTLREMQQVFLAAGAQTAFNLDGGGSSTLYFLGEVLNKPAGGVERSVSDILFFD
ncbi:MAG: phosphodiester glycosidase family protein [Clostridia bacterium]|nr:phosphodiester glycosidase family protein [Clostridia bacterium]